MKYNFKSLEKKWQKKWAQKKVFEVKEDKNSRSGSPKLQNAGRKFYVLEMFPYPSGSGLHMGHAWNYSIGDILARFKIMQGFNVLHPMGYDALGLPAENAAIKKKIHPEDYTKKSTANFMKQQKLLGLSYDWSRLINTSKPEYYKWDQWIFLKMFEKGLAYRKKASVNWCPKCETVLANEQVINGKCWRHEDTEVEIKHLEQWFLKITDYADELLDEIDNLDWPFRTKAMQKNWIGRSEGTEIDFEIGRKKFPIFTTRPDTIYGVTFMVVSAQHPKLMELVTDNQKKEIEKFLNRSVYPQALNVGAKKIKSVSQKDLSARTPLGVSKNTELWGKEGVFTGSYAINPVTKEKVPVYAGNFVVADYGSGMVMAVPAHDQRDFEFAKKYGIDIKQVIEGKISDKRAYTSSGKLINSGGFDGMENEKAKKEITKYLVEKNLGRKVVQFKLRDWLISRQRYWGTPIPIVYCEKCGVVPVPEKDLPLKLPKKVKFGKGNPLETAEAWIKTKCLKCGGKARREIDTMDTFVNSSWYFLRYCDSKNSKKIFDSKKVDYWCPIDVYVGGAEHACMHLIYFRFYTKFLADLGLLNFREPAKKLFHQGMLHGNDGNKMSKSNPKYVVLPEDVSKKYGIDTARFFLCGLASPDKDIDWDEKGIIGSLRFVNKIFDYFEKVNFKDKISKFPDRTCEKVNFKDKISKFPDETWGEVKFGKTSEKLEVKLNKTIESVEKYFETFEYRKASIEIRELFDLIEKENVSKTVLEKFLKILSPICPHITEELWEKIGNKTFLSLEKWPEVNLKISSKKFENSEKLVEKLKSDIANIKKIVGKKNPKVYVYVLPNEAELYKGIEDVKIFAVNDKEKYDPENKSKKVKPGRPGIYLE